MEKTKGPRKIRRMSEGEDASEIAYMNRASDAKTLETLEDDEEEPENDEDEEDY